MRLLLDTHVWLWMLAEPERLSARVQSMLASTDNEVALSAASVWEAGIKEALGKLPNTQPIATLVKSSVERFSLALLAITTDQALAAAALPKHHKDPFDRMLVAQASVERFYEHTDHTTEERHRRLPHASARACCRRARSPVCARSRAPSRSPVPAWARSSSRARCPRRRRPTGRHGGGRLSFQDRICLLVAKEGGFTCVSNDRRLRMSCEAEGVPVLWGLELLVELVAARAIPAEAARDIAARIVSANRRMDPNVYARFLKRIGLAK